MTCCAHSPCQVLDAGLLHQHSHHKWTAQSGYLAGQSWPCVACLSIPDQVLVLCSLSTGTNAALSSEQLLMLFPAAE